jgi:hypothetical protein
MEWLLDHFQVLLFLLLYFGPTIVRLIRRASSNSDAPELELPEEPPVREPQRAMEQVRDERPQPAAERKPGAAPPDWHTTRSAPAATAPHPVLVWRQEQAIYYLMGEPQSKLSDAASSLYASR